MLAKLISLSAKLTRAASYFGVGVAKNAGFFRADWIMEMTGLALSAGDAGAGAIDVGAAGAGGVEGWTGSSGAGAAGAPAGGAGAGRPDGVEIAAGGEV